MCIENLTWTPEVIISNSRFERTNTRGLLITTRKKVIIENNTFHRTGMNPILIANDASSWFESGAVENVTIRNNKFEECGYNSGSGAILIAPENHKLLNDQTVHKNITITNNTFNLINNTVLSARSVENLVFTGNRITYASIVDKENKEVSFNLTACKKVTIVQNRLESSIIPTISISNMQSSHIKTDLKLNKKYF